MSFAISRYEHPQVQGGTNPTIVVLEAEAGHRVEVWPAFGMNAFRWAVPGPEATPLELLYADPALFTEGRPSRSGVPVLFPFPNRIENAKFLHAGKTWNLAINDATKTHAIHGFACRSPWDVVGEGADAESAWVTGRHRSRNTAGEWWVAPWPGEYELDLTIRLRADELRLEAEVRSGAAPLPFGLGYHPYFGIPFGPGLEAGDCLLQVPASSLWELKDSIPTEKILPVDGRRDLNGPRQYREIDIDEVLTALPANGSVDALYLRGQVMGAPGVVLQVWADGAFREMCVFTPPHRQAFCIEPYTCTTNAINLQPRGFDAGWRVLPANSSAKFTVAFRLLRGATLQAPTSSERTA